MDIISLIISIITLTFVATFVLLQDPRGRPQQLFALLVFNWVLLSAIGVVRVGGTDPLFVDRITRFISPFVGSSSLLLLWLILVVFIPHRAMQPRAVVWLSLPYLLCLIPVILDSVSQTGMIYGGIEFDGVRVVAVHGGPWGPLFIGLYTLGQAVLFAMVVTVAVRDRLRRQAAWVVAVGIVLGIVVSGVTPQMGIEVLTYFSALPLYISFGWVTLRYSLFRPTSTVLKVAIESLTEGMLVVDSDSRVRYANLAAVRRFPILNHDVLPTFQACITSAQLTSDTIIDSTTPFDLRLTSQHDPSLVLETKATQITRDVVASFLIQIRDLSQLEAQNRRLVQQNDEQRRLLDLVTTLETPMIPLEDGVLLAPIVGTLDSKRLDTLNRRILEAAYTQHADLVIFDITALSLIDSLVARALVQTIQSLRLLGCDVILCGVAPSLAVTLVHQGMSMQGITITRSLQEALGLVRRTRGA